MSNRSAKGKSTGQQELVRSTRAKIEQALALNDIATAAALAESGLAAGVVEPLTLNLVAWLREERGDYAGAHELLRQALHLSPGDVMVLGAIGAVMRKEGRWEEALALLDRVVAAEPRHSAAWLERGYTLEALRSEAAAIDSYSRALALDPNLAPAYGKLADIAARKGDRQGARMQAERALAIDAGEPAATFALAVMDIEARNGAGAIARLEALLETGLKPDDRTRALTLLGDALDKEDRCDDAFETYCRAQSNFRRVYSAVLAPGYERPSHRSFIETITAQVERGPAMTPALSSPPIAGAAARHVFLLGYPRSGTTLVENILASAADVVALEEHDTLADADGVLIANDGSMPDLDGLDASIVAELRAKYWARVQKLGGAVRGKTFVDMNPFNGIKLPIIARLFPEARILIMRRDPRDVVLSCYRINFAPSPAAYAFSDLEETARHYDALMRLIELCRERLPLACHEVRYDRLVSDFEPTVRAMAAFVGLPWTDDFHAFDRTAQSRGVRTASATQVRRGLYNGGGRWRRYEVQLHPILPILAPWLERFGFSD
ncbi:sulfotransferase [Sphingosinicella sp. BN140058]|uniref:tetratricopeptide repeat-containing sulfotransferase family protein n=1 Tax=Sphingosinicella sp. BN140058 TaxID=1892855 RepID=UPI0013EA65E9|nr:sulfotransferase [Sphingosinicella sp. BN140058]